MSSRNYVSSCLILLGLTICAYSSAVAFVALVIWLARLIT